MNRYVNWLTGALLAMLLLLSFEPANAQSRKELERKRKKLEQKIAQTKKVLKETQEKQSQSLQTIEVISRQIKQREELIGTVTNEIGEISGEISTKQEIINQLNQQLQQLKKDYAAMIVRAYKARNSYNKVTYIFAADNFNQAVKRIEYLQRFGEARKRQLEKIAQTQADINNNLVDLHKIKTVKQVLVNKKENEKQELVKDKSSENNVLKSLKSKEKDLKKELRERELARAKLDKAIKNAIALEIRRKEEAERKRREAAAKKAAKSKAGKATAPASKRKEVVISPEDAQLSSAFEKNKNSLPWPLEKGYISSSFGVHRHPDLPDITIVNNGIDIMTGKGANARAVFNGKVSAVVNIAGSHTTVLVNHGEYFTIYSNLETVFVTKGQEITTKQSIGTVATDEEGKTKFHFELWKQYTKLDPEAWLYDR